MTRNNRAQRQKKGKEKWEKKVRKNIKTLKPSLN